MPLTPAQATPSVTVVIPVWGAYAGRRLDDAIASLRSQDVSKHILVVDNCSERPVPEMEEVELVRTPRRLSLGAARNYGVERTRSPYLVMWDADDLILPGTLRYLCEQLEKDRSLAAFAAAILEGATGDRHRWPRRWATVLGRFPRAFAIVHCVWSLYPTTGATMMRTDLVRDSGGYTDAESGDDWGLGVSLVFRGRLGWSERPGRLYRRHPDSVWSRHSGRRQLVAHSRAVRKRLREDPGVPRAIRASLPLIALGQYVALFVLRPPLLWARKTLRS